MMDERNISVARVDLAMAYDVVPHPWVSQLLKVVRAPKTVRCAVKKVIRQWQTDLEIKAEEGVVRIPVKFRRGLFQGDSLSPLLFSLVVAPLSKLLGVAGGFGSPYQQAPVTHLLYMDDLKVYEESQAELESTLAVVDGGACWCGGIDPGSAEVCGGTPPGW